MDRRIIDCVAMEDYAAVDAVCAEIERFEWVVFTSVNGAKFLFERLYAAGKDARSLAGARIGAIGRTTAKRLLEYGVAADVVPEVESSAGLVEALGAYEMAGRRVLLPQAEAAGRELPEGLAARGAEVRAAAVYRTVDVDPGDVDFAYIDAVLFTSGSTVRAFVRRFGGLPGRVKALALGIPTQKVARECGIEAEVVG